MSELTKNKSYHLCPQVNLTVTVIFFAHEKIYTCFLGKRICVFISASKNIFTTK